MSDWKRVFAIIFSGQLISTMSSMVVAYAVIFWLSIETESAEVLAYSTIAALLPQLVLGLFSGVFVDRWNRKRTMIFADLFIAVCTLVIAILFYTSSVKISYLYILLMMRSAGMAFHVPAMQASIPLLAPEDKLMRISGINNIIQSAGTIASPALAALLISLFDMTWILLLDVAGAILACLSLLLVHIPDPEKKDIVKRHILKEMHEGLKEIGNKPALFWIFILSVTVHFFVMPVAALFPLMTLQHFSGTAYHMSVVEIAWGIGMLAGGAILGIKGLSNYKITIIILMFILLGITFLLSGVLPSSGFIWFTVVTAVGGISVTLYSGSFTVVMQTMVEPNVLGRVFAMYTSITLLPSMAGLLATGFIADSIGIVNAFIISGSAVSLMGILAFFIPQLSEIVRREIRGKQSS